MSAPNGSGPFLLLIDYGTEGWSIQRHASEDAVLDTIKRGESFGNPIIVAEERPLQLGYDEASFNDQGEEL